MGYIIILLALDLRLGLHVRVYKMKLEMSCVCLDIYYYRINLVDEYNNNNIFFMLSHCMIAMELHGKYSVLNITYKTA